MPATGTLGGDPAGPPVGAVALQWFTKVKYLTEMPIVYTYGSIAMDAYAFD